MMKRKQKGRIKKMFGSFIIFMVFLILLFGGTFVYIFFYDMAWDRSIAKVGKYKIKY